MPEAVGDTLHQLMINNPPIAHMVHQLLGQFVVGSRPSQTAVAAARLGSEPCVRVEGSLHGAPLSEHQVAYSLPTPPAALSPLRGEWGAPRPTRPSPPQAYASRKLLQILPPLLPAARGVDRRDLHARSGGRREQGEGAPGPHAGASLIADDDVGGGRMCRDGWLPGRVHATVLLQFFARCRAQDVASSHLLRLLLLLSLALLPPPPPPCSPAPSLPFPSPPPTFCPISLHLP